LSVVREALTRLSSSAWSLEPQLGFSVLPLDRAGLEDLTGVRVEIETLALRWAIGAPTCPGRPASSPPSTVSAGRR